MLSFELSAFDLVLSVGVIVLIVLFVTTLLKLNPSGEKAKSQEEKAYEQEQESPAFADNPSQLDQQRSIQPSASRPAFQSQEEAIYQKTQQPQQIAVSATTSGASQESIEPMMGPSEQTEQPRNRKPAGNQKQTSKNSEDKDCLHYFGYLGGLPKNTPIPGECFGCQKIVDCLITPRKKH